MTIRIFSERERGKKNYEQDAGIAIYCDNTFCQAALHYPKTTRADIPAIMQEFNANSPQGWFSEGFLQFTQHFCSRHRKM